MGNPDLTEIIVVLDRSGSMASMRRSMEEGFDSFIRAQRELPGKCEVTLIQFDDNHGSPRHETVYVSRPVANVPPLELSPRGGTPLYDALGNTINEVGHRLQRTAEELRPGKVLVMVITDGEENASREFTAERVRGMVKHQEETYSWVFTFLGANIDAVVAGAAVGANVMRSANFAPTAGGVKHAFAISSSKVGGLRSGLGYTDYTTGERSAMMDGGTVAPLPADTVVTTNIPVDKP